MVKDSRGIRLGVTNSDHYATVRSAVKRHMQKADLPAPRVSRRARRLIDTGELPSDVSCA